MGKQSLSCSHSQNGKDLLTACDTPTDSDMVTAKEHLSPQTLFSPGSDNVRQLFPRSSSLSPRQKKCDRQPRKSAPRDPQRDPTLELTAKALNAAIARHHQQTKSPWARVRAGKSVATSSVATRRSSSPSSPQRKKVRPVRKNEFVTVLGDGSNDAESLPRVRSESLESLTCAEAISRVRSLETEVAKLKGDVAAMKAVLRQNGVPFPHCFRLKKFWRLVE